MPRAQEITALEEVAALLWEAHTLYESVLPHLRDDAQRDALCGVIAVRGALHLRLQDQLAALGSPCVRRAAGAHNDARCLGIFRQLVQGNHAGALAEIADWDARLREETARRLTDPRLGLAAMDNIRFTVQILDAAPAAFTTAKTPLAAAS